MPKSGLDKKNPYVNFEIAIAEKSQSLSKNLAGFVNNLAFYALPRLSSKSPNADDIKKVFRLKQQAQRKKGVATLEAWLKLAQAVVEEAEAHTPMKLDQWLQRENTYQD